MNIIALLKFMLRVLPIYRNFLNFYILDKISLGALEFFLKFIFQFKINSNS